MVFWSSIATLLITSSVVGGIALGREDMMDENAGGNEKPRNADTDTVFGTEVNVILFGGAIAFYGSVCYMAFSLTRLYMK
ncbi:hypothetical protein QTG54_007634 [Skeletonema marinoi]|uniref:Uncharacterized protein n=1 Tax=Skeletonema marinoi TaxID=267567 RepID=A0AAD9DC37_9STRA|nr:hypothetical protein QTG54_007634 [Skeletonema marinoi]